MEFSKLKILGISVTWKNDLRIPNAFLKGMKALQILVFTDVIFFFERTKIRENYSINMFQWFQARNISSLRYVENLEILVLSDTNICELPEEIVALRRLKSQRFSFTVEQQGNPPQLAIKVLVDVN